MNQELRKAVINKVQANAYAATWHNIGYAMDAFIMKDKVDELIANAENKELARKESTELYDSMIQEATQKAKEHYKVAYVPISYMRQ